ncbi:MAG: glycosyltransferase family 2 protein [Alphaproteobacteria bacterium]|nr:glycosyltransferase family 2 protein [Alphaproteobacteria bacterium]
MIAAVIPCYRVRDHILAVLAGIPASIQSIYCVDDACPQASGNIIEAECIDPRVRVIRHTTNQGVGGAVMTGYAAALADGAEIVVKIDGDGQMPLELLDNLLQPILTGRADYTKGNRFYFLRDLEGMPPSRLFGNAVLGFMTKLSSGYWSVFDPTNGFTAIHRAALSRLRLNTIKRRYFFESDMLHHLYLERAVVVDVPIPARYGTAGSSLSPLGSILPFLRGNLRNFLRRLVYTYYVRDLNIASLEFILALLLIGSGVAWEITQLWESVETGIAATAGEAVIGALPIIMGFQMLLAAIHYDTQNMPERPLQDLDRTLTGR